MSIITIDGFAWSGRKKVASLLAKALNSELIDGSYLAPIARRRGIDPDLFLERLETEHTLTRSIGDFVSRGIVLTSLSRYTDGSNLYSFPFKHSTKHEQLIGFDKRTTETTSLNPKNMRHLLESMILECTGTHNSVIVGCAGEKTFKNDPNVLRIFLTAPKEIRVARAKLELNALDKIARKKVAELDKNRTRFHEQILNHTWGDRSNYDLYLDSGTLDYGKITESILTKELNTELADRQILNMNLR